MADRPSVPRSSPASHGMSGKRINPAQTVSGKRDPTASSRSQATTAQVVQPAQGPTRKAGSLLRAIANDAATASIRRSMLQATRPPEELGAAEQSSTANRVAEWTRLDVTRFCRGIMAFARHVQMVRLTDLSRAAWRWREACRAAPSAAKSSLAAAEGQPPLPQPPASAAATVPATALPPRPDQHHQHHQHHKHHQPHQHEQEQEQEQQEHLQQHRTLARLSALYLHELREHESLRAALHTQRQALHVANASPSSAAHTMRFLLLHVTAGIKRRLRLGFQQWQLFAQKAQEQQRLARLGLQLLITAQTVDSRQRQVREAAEVNREITALMQRARAFFCWRWRALGAALGQERERGRRERALLAAAVRGLQEQTLEAAAAEAAAVAAAAERGAELRRALLGLGAVAGRVRGLGRV